MRREVKIDTAVLNPGAAEELARLVQQAGAPHPSTASTNPRSPDRFRYTLAVEDGERKCAWTFDEEQAPENLRPLVEAVRRAAQSVAADSDPKMA
jgi:hypothetical protein